MKRNSIKPFICGLTAGALIMTSAPVLAENITVALDNSIKMIIDGQTKTLPEGYTILNYEGRTYLPTRYVAEELGAAVNWDEAGRTITITSPAPKIVEKIVEVPVEVEVEKIVYVEKEGKSSNYDTLPTAETNSNVTITLKTIRNNKEGSFSGYTRVSLEVENDSPSDNIILNYASAVLTADGVTYNLSDTAFSAWDEKLLNSDIAAGKDVTGYLIFPLVDSKAKEFKITIPVRNQALKTVDDFVFEFTADISDN